MNILFITYSMKENIGVGSARSRMLYNILKNRNHNIKLLSDATYRMSYIFKNILFKKYDKIYFSGPPFSKYLIILLISIILKKCKFIVDFRDPWSLHLKNGYGIKKRNKLKFLIACFIEKNVYKRCNYFIVCTEGMYNEYKNFFKDSDKIKVIHNGHDLSFPDMNKIALQNKQKYGQNINIICCGKFASYNIDKAKSFIEILGNSNHQFKLLFIGTDNITKELFQMNSYKNICVEFKEQESYRYCINSIKKSDVGILLLRNEEFEYGTKVFDYIAVGIPIFDLFDHNKSFYSNFKKFIFDDFNKIPDLEPDFNMIYARQNQLLKLVDLIEAKGENINGKNTKKYS